MSDVEKLIYRASNEEPGALLDLALWYTEHDRPAEALRRLAGAAAQGDAAARKLLSKIGRDPADVFERIKKFAEAGDDVAMVGLAVCYLDGAGVDADEIEGLKWLSKAANQGNDDALYHLAYCYEFGIGVERDPAEAERLYRLVACQA